MGALVRRNQANALAQRQHRIAQTSNLTVLAIREGAHLQQRVANLVAVTLAIAQEEIDAARRTGQLTYHQEQALDHYREAYTHELLQSIENAHHKVYRLVTRR